MTNREFFNEIINANVSDEITAFATDALTKLNARNAKRANTPTKAQKENEPIREMIVAYITAHGAMLSTTLAEALSLTTQKVTGLCGLMVKEGILVAEKVKIPKVGERTQYALANAEEVEGE